jgi:hypothetical protein
MLLYGHFFLQDTTGKRGRCEHGRRSKKTEVLTDDTREEVGAVSFVLLGITPNDLACYTKVRDYGRFGTCDHTFKEMCVRDPY